MEIAVFTDGQGHVAALNGAGVFVVFEKTAGGWMRSRDIPFAVPDDAGLAGMKRALAGLGGELAGVQAVVTSELRGILCASLSAMGFGVWKSEGELHQQLVFVEQALRREKDAPPPEPSTCGGGGGGGRCGETRKHRSCNCCGC